MSPIVQRKPICETCAGLIFLAESANKTKKGSQYLIGGLDVRVDRKYLGRQTENFEMDLILAFLDAGLIYDVAKPSHGAAPR